MLHIGFSRQLAESGFEHRASPAPDGRIVYRLADGSGHVRVEPGEWNALLSGFADEARGIARRAKWCLFGLFPGIFVFAMTVGQVRPGAGLLVVLGIFLGPPGIYLWQSYRVKWAAKALEEKLAFRRKVPAPPPVPFKLPRWIEIASFVLVGPHLLIEMYGSVNPDAYRNTPLLGTELDWTSGVSFAILAAVLYFRLRAGGVVLPHWFASFRSRDRAEEVVDLEGGRRTDVIARARRSES